MVSVTLWLVLMSMHGRQANVPHYYKQGNAICHDIPDPDGCNTDTICTEPGKQDSMFVTLLACIHSHPECGNGWWDGERCMGGDYLHPRVQAEASR